VLLTAFGSPELTSFGAGWPPVFAVLALLSMTVANLIAGRQQSVKRMLAYSSIAHAGYALVGLVAAGNDPAASWTQAPDAPGNWRSVPRWRCSPARS